jgi:hypothetical protein
MGGARSTIGGEEECIQVIGSKSHREIGPYEDQDVGGSIILRWI